MLTVALSHGCDGSATTSLDVQIPEEILSVSAARSPFWEAEPQIEQLDEPVTDAHGNEVTERVASVRFTATEPLEDGVSDSVELSFQVPDVEGETLAFPTIQTCEKGETAWTQVPEEGQDAEELETPAPSFVVEAAAEGGHGSSGHDEEDADDAEHRGRGATEETDETPTRSAWAGLGAGVLGLLAGGTALARSRSTS